MKYVVNGKEFDNLEEAQKFEAEINAKNNTDVMNRVKEIDNEVMKLQEEYSTDDATKDNGGLMGTVNTLELDDVTRQELTKLEKGKYSKTPVETEYGYEIFLKSDEKEKPKLESVKSKIIKKLSTEKTSADSTLQQKGLIAIREKYGFEIKDEDMKVYYENVMNNLLKGN